MIGIHIVSGPRIVPAFVGTLSEADRSVDWTQAACRGEDPELWFPGRGDDLYGDARAICETCPIRDVCLEYAMTREQDLHRANRFGMWGGKTPDERARITRRRHRKPHAYIPIAERVAPTHRPQCGTAMGYETHRRNGERPCDPCRTAASKYQAERRARRAG